MSYTFGAGTGDDIMVTSGIGVIGSPISALVAGWYYPTTLTSGRFYWSCGNVVGMSVFSTTDQLQIFTDNTTDGTYTCDPNITINKWWFIACMLSGFNTGPVGACRVWVGDAETPPAEVTVTQTVAPVGNYTGATGRFVGNRGTGTVAFQGDIGWVTFIAQNNTANIVNLFNLGTSGAIADVEATNVLNKWVVPLWSGRPTLYGHGVPTAGWDITHFPLKAEGIAFMAADDATLSAYPATTINGATFTSNSPPTAPPENWALQFSRRAA